MALNLVFRSAGIAAHSPPPIAPATTIAGSTSRLSVLWKPSATPVAATAPIRNWPSAPMFHTFARKPTASPTAISISGVAFSRSSVTALRSRTGLRKKMRKPSTGFLPSAENTISPPTMVSTTAIAGDA